MRAERLGFRVESLGFRVKGKELKVSGLEIVAQIAGRLRRAKTSLRVWVLGFGIWDLKFRLLTLFAGG